jgi:hypothetical protein
MNTEQFAALGTGPSFLFNSQEMSYAEILYVQKVLNHTHAIPGPIALIQLLQPVAGKVVTTEAVHDVILRSLLTVFDSAGDAGL